MSSSPGGPAAANATPPGGSPAEWALQIGPFAALAATAAYLQAHWLTLPERFPVHWGLDGRPNGWAARSDVAVYGPLLVAALIIGVLALLGRSQLRAMRPIHPGAPVRYTEVRFRRGVRRVLLAGEYLLALTFIWVSLLPLQASAQGGKGPPGLAVLLVLPLLFVIWSSIYLRHLRPLPAPHRSTAETGGHPTGDAERHWRQGAFYVNRDDPALWVPKRSGLGYTLNFAHPAAWPLLILFTVGPLAFLAWLFFHAR
jgi:uncharacterized membrane protein